MFAKKKTQEVDNTRVDGRVYILEIALEDGSVIHKIGMTHSPRSTDRMMEILRSWFTVFRYVPHTRCRMDYGTGVPLLLEKHLHGILHEYKWVPDKKVDGYHEMFTGLDIEEVINYVKEFDYSVLLRCTSMKTKDYEYILTKLPENYKDEGFCEDVTM